MDLSRSPRAFSEPQFCSAKSSDTKQPRRRFPEPGGPCSFYRLMSSSLKRISALPFGTTVFSSFLMRSDSLDILPRVSDLCAKQTDGGYVRKIASISFRCDDGDSKYAIPFSKYLRESRSNLTRSLRCSLKSGQYSNRGFSEKIPHRVNSREYRRSTAALASFSIYLRRAAEWGVVRPRSVVRDKACERGIVTFSRLKSEEAGLFDFSSSKTFPVQPSA
jgi:hypothetical protein